MPFVLAAKDTRLWRSCTHTMKCTRDVLTESLAEFLGTFILILLGNGVSAVIVFNQVGNLGWVIAPLGWCLAVMVSVSVTGGISGCHANPAFTLALATLGKVSWKKVLPFFFAQYAGAFVASGALYAIYSETFTHFDGGTREIPPHASATAQIFASYLAEHVSTLTAVGDQIVGTMLLMLAIEAITDPKNMSMPKGFYPLGIGLSVAAVIFAFPINCGAPFNPARDLAPRVFTAIAGWGNGVFSFRGYNYFWVPVVGPHIGALIGAWAYRLMVKLHWPAVSHEFANLTEIIIDGDFKEEDDLPRAAPRGWEGGDRHKDA